MKVIRFVPPFILIVSILVFWFLLIDGIDFGYHWDERHLMNSAARVPETGLVLPRWYNYPSVAFLITLISLAIYVVGEVIQQSIPFLGSVDESAAAPFQTLAKTTLERQQNLIAALSETQQKKEFWLFARIVFASLATLSIPVIYVAVSKLVDRWVALTIGLVLMGSFHVFFHARWIAPDMLQVLWMALLILFTVSFLQNGGAWRLTVVTILSGIMIATKYPAGIFLLCPIVLANLERVDLLRTMRVVLLALICYLALTPGTFIEPRKFAYDVLWEVRHYSEYGHDVSTVVSGPTHLVLLAEYFTLRIFNMNPLISLSLWVFILAGSVEALVRHRRFALAVMLPATLYFLYLSTQKVMIVRNTLILLPVFCVCLALGIDRVSRAFKRYETYSKMGAIVLAVSIFTVSASDFNGVNHSLTRKVSDDTVAESVISEASRHAGTVYLSEEVAKILQGSGQIKPEQLVKSASVNRFDSSAISIFMISETDKKEGYFEAGDWAQIHLANRRGIYTTLVGPRDVDLDYYPNWKGRDRVVVTTPSAGANFAYWKLANVWELRIQN